MNPFFYTEKINADQPVRDSDLFIDWWHMHPRPYIKREADPRTRLNVIMLSAMEHEGLSLLNWFSRATTGAGVRADIARLTRSKHQQLCLLASLKPADESPLEYAVALEQLSVELTSCAARALPPGRVADALEFIMVEDFDHLYRIANLLDMERGIAAERVTGPDFEIMPGRPSISQHRHPSDTASATPREDIDAAASADSAIELELRIISAAAKYNMDTYMHLSCFHSSDIGRRLFQELSILEEQHLSISDCLSVRSPNDIRELLQQQVAECFACHSCAEHEPDDRIKAIFGDMLKVSAAQLSALCKIVKVFEGAELQEVLSSGGELPPPMDIRPDMEHVRRVLRNKAEHTQLSGELVPVWQLPPDHRFFEYQRLINSEPAIVPSHAAIKRHIDETGADFRHETALGPVEWFHNRQSDDIFFGRGHPRNYLP